MAGLSVDSAPDMSFDVVEDNDRTVTVNVSGELDITNIDALASGVAPALGREPTRLVVAVRNLRFADSSAIALWVQWATSVPEIELRDASAFLRRVVESMGLTETLSVAP